MEENNPQVGPTKPSSSQSKKDWTDEYVALMWQRRWQAYVDEASTKDHSEGIPALKQLPQKQHLKIHEKLKRSESSLLTQIRTGKIGLAGFLHRRKVPGYASPGCQCGAEYQDVEHLLQCEIYTSGRERLFREAGTNNLQEMVEETNKAKPLVRWVMGLGILHQFKLAEEMLLEDERVEEVQGGE